VSLNLSPNTFGKTPAALYLTLYLNEQGDRTLVRKVGRMLDSFRESINDVICCHLHTDEMKRATFNRMMTMLSDSAREAALRLPDTLCQNLVTNILVGEIKSWKTRSMNTARLQRNIARNTKPGQTVPELKVTPRRGEETDDERIEKLKERSRAYLARKGKTNTLY
jgi:hypothetical protein